MSSNIVESLPQRKFAPAKMSTSKQTSNKSGGGGSKKGSSAKDRVTQAVYDIRYRARKDDIDLKAAYNQYMANSSLSQDEKTAVKIKLFGKGGMKEAYSVGTEDWASDGVVDAMYKVFVENESDEMELSYLKQLDEEEQTKYKVRVKDKNGKSYVRYADRAKITQLRQNPNIESVEMTDHGDPKGNRTRAKKDFDGDGKKESSSKEHAGVVHNAIQRAKGGKPDGKDTRKEEYIRNEIYRTVKKQLSEELPVTKTAQAQKERQQKSPTQPAVSPANGEEPLDPLQAKINHLNLRMKLKTLQQQEKDFDKDNPTVPTPTTKNVKESTINTADCEKKPEEKEKDMRGTYAKINLVKNKLRSMGAKNPMVMLDDIDDEDEKKKVDEGAYETVKKVLDAGSKFVKTNPVGKALGNVVKPFNSTDGGSNRKSATKQSQQEIIDKNKK